MNDDHLHAENAGPAETVSAHSARPACRPAGGV